MNRAHYTYAVARAVDPGAVAGVRGIDGTAVGLVRHRDLVAVVSAVPHLDEAALRARLDRLEDLEVVARAHHAVVMAVAAHAVTAPLRLATVHRDGSRVADVLRAGYDEFRATLDRLAGRVELGVKLHLRAGAPADSPAGAPADPADSPAAAPADPAGAGRAYLRRLGQRHRQRDDDRQRAAGATERIDAALAALAVDRTGYRPQPAQLSGTPGSNIFNAAYLVPADRVDAFTDLAGRLADPVPGLRVEVTGPWAPYSFVRREGT